MKFGELGLNPTCMCVLQLSRQRQLLEQESTLVKDEEKKHRHEMRKFRDGLVMRKEVMKVSSLL